MTTVDARTGRATREEVAAARAVLDGVVHQDLPARADVLPSELAQDLVGTLAAARERLVRLQAWAAPAACGTPAGAPREVARPA